MSTLLEEHPDHWVVKTIDAPGKRRRIGRLRVAVGKAEPEAVWAEVLKQAEALRLSYGIPVKPQEPVV